MARLGKADIEKKLLAGQPITWRDTNGKSHTISLELPATRRLFAFLLHSSTRDPTGLKQEFIDGLWAAYISGLDPSTESASHNGPNSVRNIWRLQSITTEGFGGLNVWGGPPFFWSFDSESVLIEGMNGSGKSSLIGAIIWALTGERPKDQVDGQPHDPRQVFGSDDRPAGQWPPIASYPASITGLSSAPRVRVRLDFRSETGQIATVERVLDGTRINTTIDPSFQIPSVLIDAGISMPARLARIRFNEGGGRLSEAVQKLTGLDDLVAIGKLADGLCHGAREYLSYKKRELQQANNEFAQSVEDARQLLAKVQVTVPLFKITDTDDRSGSLAKLGKELVDKAGQLSQVIAGDLAPNLDLTSLPVQHQVIKAIGSAQDTIDGGLDAITFWTTLGAISTALSEEVRTRISDGIEKAKQSTNESLRILQQSTIDSKFQLKAVAAKWHEEHASGPITSCPLCEHELEHGDLASQLEALRSIGALAARTFDDSLRAIISELESTIPKSLRQYSNELISGDPRDQLVVSVRSALADRYSTILTRLSNKAATALQSAPSGGIPSAAPIGDPITTEVNVAIWRAERLLKIAGWHREKQRQWQQWWEYLRGSPDREDGLAQHLAHLSESLAKAEPYRKGAELLQRAWASGKTASVIDAEVNRRTAVGDHLSPLKGLVSLAESVAGDAIRDLSERIAKLLQSLHLSENLLFQGARVQRKEGIVVRAGFVADFRIDATLVANTSWLRALLWCFLFALREEGVDQAGFDPFPVFAFDDPQSTFDTEHRHRWAAHIASLQNGPSKAQVVLTSYDSQFLELIQVDGVTGRSAMLVSAGPELGHVAIFEGGTLQRKWEDALHLNTPQAGRDYISAVREQVEGLLRLMLRGEHVGATSAVSGPVLGDCRSKIEQLHRSAIAPWSRSEYQRLVGTLDKNNAAIKYLEVSHHAGRAALGMPEAQTVHDYWESKLRPRLEHAFRLARDYRLLHGRLNALYATPSSAVLPEGNAAAIKRVSIKTLGRASALSNGRVADGRFSIEEYEPAASTKVVLWSHYAFRLAAQTLEPVARSGDVLLVKTDGSPPPGSLVIALNGDRILARRFLISENDSDLAALVAQTLNPRVTPSPVIAHKGTLKLFQIVGVLFQEPGWPPLATTEAEICECGADAMLRNLTAKDWGLVEVLGDSAEPLALDKQSLIITEEISVDRAVGYEGRPVVAADDEDNRYFKRLRFSPDRVVLESLDSGGDYPPVILNMPGTGSKSLQRIWPVAGVLFET